MKTTPQVVAVFEDYDQLQFTKLYTYNPRMIELQRDCPTNARLVTLYKPCSSFDIEVNINIKVKE